jgi:valyl-tRNA synthetase
MRNIRDWCISRQLWWGHRIPAWHCADCAKITVDRDDPTSCAHCGSAEIQRDTDVLDTWFSSGLWPFSTLGWPDKTKDLQTFYPTSLMIMGFEILFFWCARMMMLGIEMAGDVPFRHVYIHGIVRDSKGKKMSKTTGNTVDPLDITSKYGTDAVRMALLQAASPGADILWTEDKLPAARAFANKIWNAARFLFVNMERSGVEPQIPTSGPGPAETLEDRWIRSRLNAAAETVNRAIDQQRFHEVGQTMWHFFWSDFCDWYIEVKKLRFTENSGVDHNWRNLLWVFDQALRLLHPAMPFITEELWQRLRNNNSELPASISISALPQANATANDPQAELDMQTLQAIITEIRNARAARKLDPKLAFPVTIHAVGATLELVQRETQAIAKLANVTVTCEDQAPKGDFDIVYTLPQAQMDAQIERLKKDNAQLEKNISNTDRQLNDEKFLAKAPQKIVDSMRQKLDEYKVQLDKNNEELRALGA